MVTYSPAGAPRVILSSSDGDYTQNSEMQVYMKIASSCKVHFRYAYNLHKTDKMLLILITVSEDEIRYELSNWDPSFLR
jgi:hypothetical protein